MRNILPQNLLHLAQNCPAPLYVVGGSVRDFLCGHHSITADWDICAPMPPDVFGQAAKQAGFTVRAIYRNTGTVKLCAPDKTEYEYSCFRSDKYVRGIHQPVEIFFTDDIQKDARRRDFTANAVYYDINADTFVDPLNGIAAIHEKRLTTVAPAKKVFGEDGLRLMRLARFAAQLGFTPDKDCLQGARENAALIKDISAERIFSELCAILSADKRYGVPDGAYHGLQLLDETGVLPYILPELTQGKGMAQRPDFHKYDVLEHSFRAVKYADERVRFAALLHDVGKPLCLSRDGNAHAHHTEGERLCREILTRLKAPKRFTERTVKLVALHMYDFDCKTSENKLRRFFAKNAELLDELLLLKQADFSACTDDTSIAPTCAKWKALLHTMYEENAPFRLKELAVSGKDLLDAGIQPTHIAAVLQTLLDHAVVHPSQNEKSRLCKLAKGFEKNIANKPQAR